MNPLLNSCVPFFAQRSKMAAAYGERIYFFGGVGSGGTESIQDVSNDLWCFDSDRLSWSVIQSQADSWPSPRRCAGWIRYGDALSLWGGSGVSAGEDPQLRHTFLNDVWRFSPEAGNWSLIRDTDDHRYSPDPDGSRPAPRYTPVLQSIGKMLFLFGGYTEDRLGKRKLNDAWVWPEGPEGRCFEIRIDGTEGYGQGAMRPGLRYGTMSAHDERYVYICGGFSDEGDHIDLWRFDPATHEWRLLCSDAADHQMPEPRYCAAMTRWADSLYLFGGRSRRNPKANFNDLWCFDLRALKWRRLHGHRRPHRYDPEADYPAYHAKAASATIGRHWYIWGGEGEHGHVSDFWRFDLVDHMWQLIQPARTNDPIFW